MTQTDPQTPLSLKKLRFGVLLAGVVVFAGALWLFRQTPAPPVADNVPQPEPELESAQVQAAPVEPDQLTEAAWRLGNTPSDTSIDDVAAELQLADDLLAEGVLFNEDSTGALGRYASILRSHPDHPEAREGFDSVVGLLMEALTDHAQRRRISAGADIYQALRRAAVDNDELTRLGDRLEALQKSAELIALAEADLQAERLLQPAGRSALDRLRRATQLDPGSVALADRLVALERRLIDEALVAARQVDFGRAEAMLDGAQRARGGSSAVTFARDQVRTYRRNRIEETAGLARTAMRNSRFPDAEHAIDSVRSLGAEDTLLAALDEELRLSRRYSIFRPGQGFTDELSGGGEGPLMVVLPHGEFQMGAAGPRGQASRFERPAHRVSFGRGFALSRAEVTVAEFGRFVLSTGYVTDAEREGSSHVYSESTGRVGRRKRINWRHAYNGRDAGPTLPVVHVSWNDARAFARWLADQSGHSYRLPSEAEFEYALRGGTGSRYWWGDGSPDRPVENLTGEGDRSIRRLTWTVTFEDYTDGFWGPAPVASLEANPFGLFDLVGNVQEWVADCWHDSYVRAPRNGAAWVNRGCSDRVVRGTFWGGAPETARASARHAFSAEFRGAAIGFRVARDLVNAIPPQVAGR